MKFIENAKQHARKEMLRRVTIHVDRLQSNKSMGNVGLWPSELCEPASAADERWDLPQPLHEIKHKASICLCCIIDFSAALQRPAPWLYYGFLNEC